MNKEIKKKWVKALRSGKYNQTTNALCKESSDGSRSYCCLGVLTDLYLKESEGTWVKDLESQSLEHIELMKNGVSVLGFKGSSQWEDDLITGCLPHEVGIWAGLENDDPMTHEDRSLIELNDGGCLFKDIAEIIERDL